MQKDNQPRYTPPPWKVSDPIHQERWNGKEYEMRYCVTEDKKVLPMMEVEIYVEKDTKYTTICMVTDDHKNYRDNARVMAASAQLVVELKKACAILEKIDTLDPQLAPEAGEVAKSAWALMKEAGAA